MNESIVDVLIYLFENYMDGDSNSPSDQTGLQEELIQAGFPLREIEKALLWLDELAAQADTPYLHTHREHSIRVFAPQESNRLDTDARGFLLFLEHNAILDPVVRELVIERALALDTNFITVDELKWIVLLVLMSQSGQEKAFARMEEMVYNEPAVYLH